LSFGGINRVGLKRRGFSCEDKKIIKKIYTIYFRSGSNRNKALEKIESELEPSNYRDRILEFIHSSERGII
jgi:UDP-N-acetylglucosamine acyltransferase